VPRPAALPDTPAGRGRPIRLRFSLKGWAALYKHAEGTGVISCNNGKSYPVNIVAVGGGLTAGKYRVDNGKGKFSDVMNTNDLFGDYAQGEANAALVKGGTAQVLTKGTVSLALAGAGEGVDLGIRSASSDQPREGTESRVTVSRKRRGARKGAPFSFLAPRFHIVDKEKTLC
jgi:hypothetical protein